MANTVIHRPAKNRFEVVVDGHTAVLDYEERTGALVFTHTYVPGELRGGGVAAQLTETALLFARAQEKRVVPACGYVAAYLQKHPEYADLVAREG